MLRFALIGCLVLALVGCGGSDDDDVSGDNSFSLKLFADPPTEYRPQTRWWWPGAAVEDAVLAQQLDSFVEVGYGAVEIQPFMATLTQDDLERDPRIRAVGDATFLERLRTAACAARDRGLPWDLTFGSGWSTGGVGLAEDGARQLLAAELSLVGPATYNGPLPVPEPPGWIEGTNRTLPAIDGFDEVLVPVAILGAEVLDDSAGAPVTLGDIVDLGDQVENETLSWVVPAGTHRVLAIYENRTQHYPAGAAYPGELQDARIIDHLDRRGVESFIEREFGRWIEAVSDCPPRAVFVDSFELVGELPWTTRFGEKFASAFGYEIEPLLPFLFLEGGESEYVNIVTGAGPPRFRSDDSAAAAPGKITKPSAVDCSPMSSSSPCGAGCTSEGSTCGCKRTVATPTCSTPTRWRTCRSRKVSTAAARTTSCASRRRRRIRRASASSAARASCRSTP